MSSISAASKTLSRSQGAGVERHVFDESQFKTVFARKASERNDVGIGDPFHRHGVDLHRLETGLFRGEDALDDLLEAAAAGDFAELCRVHRVEADVDPAQAGVMKRFRQRGQQNAVGRQADVLDAGDRNQHFDELGNVLAHKWFAAGEADFVDPQRDRRADDADDFFEREQARRGMNSTDSGMQ